MLCHYAISKIRSPGVVLTNVLGDLKSNEPIADGLTAKQVLT